MVVLLYGFAAHYLRQVGDDHYQRAAELVLGSTQQSVGREFHLSA